MRSRRSDVHRDDLEPGHEYRVLSLHPQWAWAIIFGGKNIENRSWSTPYRGRVLIHASSRKASAEDLASDRDEICRKGRLSVDELPAVFERSAIIGSVEIVDCIENAHSPWAYSDNLHWVLREPRALRNPIVNVNGKLGLWRWTAGIDDAASSPTRRSASNDGPKRRAPRARSVAAIRGDVATPRTESERSILDVHTDEVMVAMREVAEAGPGDEQAFLRQVSRKLGFARMGSRVQGRLKRELHVAVKRRILIREHQTVRAATASLGDYDVATLVAVLKPLLRTRAAGQGEIELAIVRYLGFADAVKPANDVVAAVCDATGIRSHAAVGARGHERRRT